MANQIKMSIIGLTRAGGRFCWPGQGGISMAERKCYKIKNWRQYNEALKARYEITLWLGADARAAWLNEAKTGRRGQSDLYADAAVQCVLTLKEVYSLPLRGAEGLTRSLFRQGGVQLPVPDYSTLCRRRKRLQVSLPRLAKRHGAKLHLVVDSTGLKIYGEGEWKVRQHGWTKRRTWRKLHLGIDADTQEIAAAVLTEANAHDAPVLPALLRQTTEPLGQVAADGAYDTIEAHLRITERQAQAVIPPRENAVRWPGDSPPAQSRNGILALVAQLGLAGWKKTAGYHRRSLAETAMSRHKTIFGDKLTARCLESQRPEALLRCAILNRMTALGMPESCLVN